MPGGVLGYIVTGYVMKKFSMRCRQMMALAVICQIIAVLCVFGLLLRCPNIEFIGLNEDSINKKLVNEPEAY